MTSPVRISESILATFAITLLCMLAAIASQPAQAQSLTVLYSFTDNADGAKPYAGVTTDGAGNLYGTTVAAGDFGGECSMGSTPGCGVVYKLTQKNSHWLYENLYTFHGPDGEYPQARVIFGPDGTLYGTTIGGGPSANGVIFRLTPPPTFCRSVSCPWTETLLQDFQTGNDGAEPASEVLFDQAGNFYGTAYSGGTAGYGVVYEVTPSGGDWIYSVLYSFNGGQDGRGPWAGLTFDQAGNLYGTTAGGGGPDYGTVYELTPSGGSWQETILHAFVLTDGTYPYGGVTLNQGNLYGGTSINGECGIGTLYELVPGNGEFTRLHCFPYHDGGEGGPYASLSMDSAGNLYGTARGSSSGCGEVFELTPQGGGWTYTTLHTFEGGDGCQPISSVLIDANGNLFGTTSAGGANGQGEVWEITR